MKIGFVLALSASYIFAAGDIKNLEAYKMHCKICHGAAYKGAAMKTEAEWDELFADNAKNLKELHKNDKKASETMSQKRFDSDAKRMIKFLRTNASDTGAVRACDGINCG